MEHLDLCFSLHPPHIHTHALLDHGCMICYSLGPIFGFANYLKQVCLSFPPYLKLHKSLLEVGERRCTNGLGEDTNTMSD